MSVMWVNWLRIPPVCLMRAGQETTMEVREPPRWEAIFLSHW